MEAIIVAAISTIGSLTVAFGTIWYTNKINKQKKRSAEDLNEDYVRKEKVFPILEEVKYELDACRVQEWAFSNGDTTFAGQHLKKMSVLVETCTEEYSNIGHYFQLVPTKKFERVLDDLYESNQDHIVSNEFKQYDELAALYSQFNIKSILLIKIVDHFGKWVGLLTVMFDSEKTLNEGEIAFAKLMAARISNIK